MGSCQSSHSDPLLLLGRVPAVLQQALRLSQTRVEADPSSSLRAERLPTRLDFTINGEEGGSTGISTRRGMGTG